MSSFSVFSVDRLLTFSSYFKVLPTISPFLHYDSRYFGT